MNFGQAITTGFSKYVNFTDRAARSEYWFWTLFVFLVGIAASIIDLFAFPAMETGPISIVTSLGLLIPGIAVSARRLHDIDRTGWWLLIAFTVIGIIVLIVWACQKGTDGPNRFGPDPLGGY